MIKELHRLPDSRVEIEIVGSAVELKTQFTAELAEVSKSVKVTGFRPGKAPAAKALAQIGRERIESGALDRLVSHLYYEAIQEKKFVPVGTPTVDVTKYSAVSDDSTEAEVVTFTATVDVLPEVDVTGYEKISLKSSAAETVGDEELAKVTDYLRKQRAILKETTPTTELNTGMWTDIAFHGSVDGVERADMQSEHHPMVQGEGQLIPGFEEQLEGMVAGGEKTFTVTFPADYHAKELSSKQAEFRIKVHEIKEVILPELDDEFSKQFGHESKLELLAAIKSSLIEEKAQEFKRKKEEEVLDQLLALAKLELPKTLVEQEIDRVFVDATKRLSQVPGQWERYLEQTGKTPDELKEESRAQAERNVRSGLILGKLIQLEKITDSDKAGQEVLDRILERASR